MKLAAVLLMLCGFVTAQTRPADVKGWDVVTWGMTERQAVAASEGRFKPLTTGIKNRTDRDGVATYGMDLKVDAFTMTASIVANPDGFVTSVLVVPTSSKTPLHYQALLTALTAKYGQPDLRDVNGGVTTARWVFPTTIIELQMIALRGLATIVGVEYRPNRPNSGL